MCLIIHKKTHDIIGEYFFKNVWEKNHDGYGILFMRDNIVQSRKGLTYEGFIKDYLDAGLESGECLIHFRMATHGKIDHENLHPFEVIPNLWIMHNGIIDAPDHANIDLSDTWRFANLVLRPIFMCVNNPQEFLRSESFTFLMSQVAGYSNRLAFMDSEGVYLTPEIGDWDKTTTGLCVSNTYAYSVDKPSPPARLFGFQKYNGDSLQQYNGFGWPDNEVSRYGLDDENTDSASKQQEYKKYLLHQDDYKEKSIYDTPIYYPWDFEDSIDDAIDACYHYPDAAGELLYEMCKERKESENVRIKPPKKEHA